MLSGINWIDGEFFSEMAKAFFLVARSIPPRVLSVGLPSLSFLMGASMVWETHPDVVTYEGVCPKGRWCFDITMA